MWPCDPSGPTPPVPPLNLGPLLRCTPDAHYTPDTVITSIGRLVPVVLTPEITNVWYTNLQSEHTIDDVSGNSSQKDSTDHAVLVQGVREDDVGSPVLLARNSQGHLQADNGCVSLSLGYLHGHILWGRTTGGLL